MIFIKVKCFSQVKYALGVDELTFQLDEDSTSNDLENIIRKKAGPKSKISNRRNYSSRW
jgi:molybdopterin converting factor small subunit